MRYLNLDLDYFDHPKTRRLVGLLGRGAEGLPIKLWCYCGKYHAESGSLADYSEQEIESIVGWWGKVGEAVSALKKVGFFTPNLEIKDWKEINGHLAAFKQRAKTAAKARWSCLEDATSNAQASDKQCPSLSNHTNQPTKQLPPGFADFWAVYPPRQGVRQGKAEALRVWQKNAISGPIVSFIIEAVKKQARTSQWREENGKYIPLAATWLNQRRWEDEIQTPKAPGSDEAQMKAIWKQSGLSLCHGKKIEKPEGGDWQCSYCNQGQEWYKPKDFRVEGMA